MSRSDAHCRRTVAGQRCGALRHEHDEHDACPRLPGGLWLAHAETPGRAGTSFDADEVVLLGKLLEAVTRGADARELVRAPAFASLASKALSLGRRVREQRAEQAARNGNGAPSGAVGREQESER